MEKITPNPERVCCERRRHNTPSLFLCGLDYTINTSHSSSTQQHLQELFLFRPPLTLPFLPRLSRPSCPILLHVPRALGFKPLRASFFPPVKSFEAECVSKAFFLFFLRGQDQSWTEIGTDRELEWTLGRRLWPWIVSPQNPPTVTKWSFCEAKDASLLSLLLAKPLRVLVTPAQSVLSHTGQGVRHLC